ncbi:hypothetical protein CTEN210_17020 [Chaetoceros tenuissimus]|uniref:Major facilitator superfamily (MFS) profile domain-containing protein n=1 Tax=Chaetoceros tenuissimus TaxID=426638 RepID=A0AAD3HEU4_9STRA|nr:hypothetical protein CTEN210_17020 [Chaetoceros tenuissimus]
MSLQSQKLDSDQQRHRIWIFVVLLALSGIFSSTFTLTFAYIADTVKRKNDRVTAYGLALATFGLSFTIGPMAGGYLAHVIDYDDQNAASSIGQDEGNGMEDVMSPSSEYYIHPIGQQRVFCSALVLTILDLLYIYFILPESVPNLAIGSRRSQLEEEMPHNDHDDSFSVYTTDTRTSVADHWNNLRTVIPNVWSPFDTLRIFSGDPFMYEVGCIAMLYYTSLWAVHNALRSCIGIAYEGWQLFVCVLLSMIANLVYPSLTSLVSSAVAPDMVGEALGAINGIKALTEGVGPLIFGTLMTFSEKSMLPGWPYLIASSFAVAAYKRGASLPDENDEEYLSERYMKKPKEKKSISALSEIELERSMQENEYIGLLSEIDEVDENEFVKANEQMISDLDNDSD